MVETVVQIWTSLDRKVQHECVAAITLLGQTCGQNGPYVGLCRSLDMSKTTVVEIAPTLLERGRERQMERGVSKTVQNL